MDRTGTSPLDRRPSIPIMLPLSLFSLCPLLPLFALLSMFAGTAAGAQDRLQWISPGSAAEPPEIELSRISEDGLQVEFRLPALTVREIQIGGATYQEVAIPGGALTGATGEPMLPVFSRFLEIPDRADVQITSTVLEVEEAEGLRLMPAQGIEGSAFVIDRAAYLRRGYGDAPVARVAGPALMRGRRLVPLAFAPVRYDAGAGRVWIARRIRVEVRFAGVSLVNERLGPARPRTESFDHLYRHLVLNDPVLDDQAPPSEQRPQRGTWLLISSSASAVTSRLQPLIDWRRRQGFPVYAATTDETGTSAASIKAFIQNAYDTWEAPPEHVVLAGDATGGYSLPCWHESVSGHNGEGDHPYVLLEGDDILADAHIGRLSFSTLQELETIVAKVVSYESAPYLAEPQWFTQACLVGDPIPSGISTIQCQQWIKTRLRQIGYARIDTIFAEPFVSQMRTSLNGGGTIFCYRGIVGFSGWTNSHIYALTNTNKPFFSVTCTCGTGSFEDGTSNNEAFLRHGTPSEPKAAVGAIATATTGTHTRFNNCYTLGVFQGLLYEDQWEMGAAHSRGKSELYLNYQAVEPTQVTRYSYWNNLMGDPACRVWTACPTPLTVEYPASLPLGTTMVPIRVHEEGGATCEGAQVCLLKEGETFSVGTTDASGNCELLVNTPTSGTMKLTVTKHNRQPLLGDITVAAAPVFVSWLSSSLDDDDQGESSGDGDQVPNPGETIEWGIRLKNWGTEEAQGISAILASTDPYLEILTNERNYGTIPAGSESAGDGAFRFRINPACPHNHRFRFALDIRSPGDLWRSAADLTAASADLVAGEVTVYNNLNGILDPSETSEVSIRLTNQGAVGASATSAWLTSLSPFVSVQDADGSYGTIPRGESADNATDRFRLTAATNTFGGHLAVLRLVTTFNNGITDTTVATITVGRCAVGDPIGPDHYGYYAFDQLDTQSPEAPVYDWVETDPAFGGGGTVVELGDYGVYQDKSRVVPLPFPFRFYGRDFTSATICSNGWIAMGETYLTDYRNWTIPCAGAPANLIAVFWDDLQETSTAHVYQMYDQPGHRFVVQWSRLTNDYYPYRVENFEVILYDPAWYPAVTGDGVLLMQYQEVNNYEPVDGYATVGVQNETHTDGLLYTFYNRYPSGAAALSAGTAIRFVPGGTSTVSAAAIGGPRPVFTLAPAQPNPFSGATVVRYSLDQAGPAALTIHDVSGRVVRRLVQGPQSPGTYQVVWDGQDDDGHPSPNGLYFYRLTLGWREEYSRVVRLR